MRLAVLGPGLLLVLLSVGACEAVIAVGSAIDLASKDMSRRPQCSDYLAQQPAPGTRRVLGPGGLCVGHGPARIWVCEKACGSLTLRPPEQRPAAEAALIENVRNWIAEVKAQERAAGALAAEWIAAGAALPVRGAQPSRRVCEHYLSLVTGNEPEFLQHFGPDGRCWSAGPAVSGRCSQQCVQLTGFVENP